ncbi:GNAT family N-acetyltransferase [Nocardia sp. CA-135953]|uniref:GNAT family N-acetyltransferase n=1 Tax=Nocardia sp. CA-135953 TaxID=3239978 RepID=UPI003D958BF6
MGDALSPNPVVQLREVFEGLPSVVRRPIEMVVFGGDLPRADISRMRWMAAELRDRAAAINGHALDVGSLLAQQDSVGVFGDQLRAALHSHQDGAAKLHEQALTLADQADGAANDAEKTLCVMFAFGIELAWRIIKMLSAAAAAGPAGEVAAAPAVEATLTEGRAEVELMRAGLKETYGRLAANAATRLSALGPVEFALTAGKAALLPAAVDGGAQLLQAAAGYRNLSPIGANGENPKGIDVMSMLVAGASGAGGAVGGALAGRFAPAVIPRMQTSRILTGLVHGTAGAAAGLGAAAMITGWPEGFEHILAPLLNGAFAGTVHSHAPHSRSATTEVDGSGPFPRPELRAAATPIKISEEAKRGWESARKAWTDHPDPATSRGQTAPAGPAESPRPDRPVGHPNVAAPPRVAAGAEIAAPPRISADAAAHPAAAHPAAEHPARVEHGPAGQQGTPDATTGSEPPSHPDRAASSHDDASASTANPRDHVDEVLAEFHARSGDHLPEELRLSNLPDEVLKAGLFHPDERESLIAGMEIIRRQTSDGAPGGMVLRGPQLEGGFEMARRPVQMLPGQGKTLMFMSYSMNQAVRHGSVLLVTTADGLAHREFTEYQRVLRDFGIDVLRADQEKGFGPVTPGRPAIVVATGETVGHLCNAGHAPPRRVVLDEMDAIVDRGEKTFIRSKFPAGGAPAETAREVFAAHDFLAEALGKGQLSHEDFGLKRIAEEVDVELPDGTLEVGTEYWYDGQAALTPAGRAKVEALPDGNRWLRHMGTSRLEMAASAEFTCRNNTHYVMDQGKIVPINQDEHGLQRNLKTSSESRWSAEPGKASLAQAVEAKEIRAAESIGMSAERHGIVVRPDPESATRITAPEIYGTDRFFDHITGASGTLTDLGGVLKTVYGLEIPHAVDPFNPSRLVEGQPDVHENTRAKLNALAGYAHQMWDGGQGRFQEILCHRNDLVDKQVRALLRTGVPREAIEAVDADRIAKWGADWETELQKVFDAAGEQGKLLVINRQGQRGVDINVSDAVLAKGGMHVWMTEVPEHAYIYEQGKNRTARNGKPGTAQALMSPQDALIRNAMHLRGVRETVIQYEQAVADHRSDPTAATHDKLVEAGDKLASLVPGLQQRAHHHATADFILHHTPITTPEALIAALTPWHPSDLGGPDQLADRSTRLAGLLGIPTATAFASALDQNGVLGQNDADPLVRLLDRANLPPSAVEALRQHLDATAPGKAVQYALLTDEQARDELTPRRDRLAEAIGWKNLAEIEGAEGLRRVGAAMTNAQRDLAHALGVADSEATTAKARDVLGEAVARQLSDDTHRLAPGSDPGTADRTAASNPVADDLTARTAAAENSDAGNVVAAASLYLATAALLDLVTQIHRRSPNSCVNNGVTAMRVLCPDNADQFTMPSGGISLRGYKWDTVRSSFRHGSSQASGSLDEAVESLRRRPGGVQVLVYKWKNTQEQGSTDADNHLVLLVNDSELVDSPNLKVVDLAASRDGRTDKDFGPEDLKDRRALLNKAVPFDNWQREQQKFIDRLSERERAFWTIDFDQHGDLVPDLADHGTLPTKTHVPAELVREINEAGDSVHVDEPNTSRPDEPVSVGSAPPVDIERAPADFGNHPDSSENPAGMPHVVEDMPLDHTAEQLELSAASATDILADEIAVSHEMFDHRAPADLTTNEQNRPAPWNKVRTEPEQPPIPSGEAGRDGQPSSRQPRTEQAGLDGLISRHPPPATLDPPSSPTVFSPDISGEQVAALPTGGERSSATTTFGSTPWSPPAVRPTIAQNVEYSAIRTQAHAGTASPAPVSATTHVGPSPRGKSPWSRDDRASTQTTGPGTQVPAAPLGAGELEGKLAEHGVVVGDAAVELAFGVRPPGVRDVVEVSVPEWLYDRLQRADGWSVAPMEEQGDQGLPLDGRAAEHWPRHRGQRPVLARGRVRVSVGWHDVVSHEDLSDRSWRPGEDGMRVAGLPEFTWSEQWGMDRYLPSAELIKKRMLDPNAAPLSEDVIQREIDEMTEILRSELADAGLEDQEIRRLLQRHRRDIRLLAEGVYISRTLYGDPSIGRANHLYDDNFERREFGVRAFYHNGMGIADGLRSILRNGMLQHADLGEIVLAMIAASWSDNVYGGGRYSDNPHAYDELKSAQLLYSRARSYGYAENIAAILAFAVNATGFDEVTKTQMIMSPGKVQELRERWHLSDEDFETAKRIAAWVAAEDLQPLSEPFSVVESMKLAFEDLMSRRASRSGSDRDFGRIVSKWNTRVNDIEQALWLLRWFGSLRAGADELRQAYINRLRGSGGFSHPDVSYGYRPPDGWLLGNRDMRRENAAKCWEIADRLESDPDYTPLDAYRDAHLHAAQMEEKYRGFRWELVIRPGTQPWSRTDLANAVAARLSESELAGISQNIIDAILRVTDRAQTFAGDDPAIVLTCSHDDEGQPLLRAQLEYTRPEATDKSPGVTKEELRQDLSDTDCRIAIHTIDPLPQGQVWHRIQLRFETERAEPGTVTGTQTDVAGQAGPSGFTGSRPSEDTPESSSTSGKTPSTPDPRDGPGPAAKPKTESIPADEGPAGAADAEREESISPAPENATSSPISKEIVERAAYKVGLGREEFLENAPYFRELLDRLVADTAAGGILAHIFGRYDDAPLVALTVFNAMTAFRYLGVSGIAPELAHFFPTAQGYPHPVPIEQMWPVFEAAMREHRDELARYFSDRPLIAQANVPERGCALYPALLHIAHQSGRPIVLLEGGSSGGLLLNLDRFGYRSSDRDTLVSGVREPELIFDDAWSGLPPDIAGTPLHIVERRGCDLNPFDIRTDRGEAGLMVVTGYYEPHQIAMQESAIRTARRHNDWQVDRGDAIQWLKQTLAKPRPDDTTVVVISSLFTGFLSPQQLAEYNATIAAAAHKGADIVFVDLRRPTDWTFDPDNPTYPTELGIITHRGDTATEEIFAVHDRDGKRWRPDMSEPISRTTRTTNPDGPAGLIGSRSSEEFEPIAPVRNEHPSTPWSPVHSERAEPGTVLGTQTDVPGQAGPSGLIGSRPPEHTPEPFESCPDPTFTAESGPDDPARDERLSTPWSLLGRSALAAQGGSMDPWESRREIRRHPVGYKSRLEPGVLRPRRDYRHENEMLRSRDVPDPPDESGAVLEQEDETPVTPWSAPSQNDTTNVAPEHPSDHGGPYERPVDSMLGALDRQIRALENEQAELNSELNRLAEMQGWDPRTLSPGSPHLARLRQQLKVDTTTLARLFVESLPPRQELARVIDDIQRRLQALGHVGRQYFLQMASTGIRHRLGLTIVRGVRLMADSPPTPEVLREDRERTEYEAILDELFAAPRLRSKPGSELPANEDPLAEWRLLGETAGGTTPGGTLVEQVTAYLEIGRMLEIPSELVHTGMEIGRLRAEKARLELAGLVERHAGPVDGGDADSDVDLQISRLELARAEALRQWHQFRLMQVAARFGIDAQFPVPLGMVLEIDAARFDSRYSPGDIETLVSAFTEYNNAAANVEYLQSMPRPSQHWGEPGPGGTETAQQRPPTAEPVDRVDALAHRLDELTRVRNLRDRWAELCFVKPAELPSRLESLRQEFATLTEELADVSPDGVNPTVGWVQRANTKWEAERRRLASGKRNGWDRADELMQKQNVAARYRRLRFLLQYCDEYIWLEAQRTPIEQLPVITDYLGADTAERQRGRQDWVAVGDPQVYEPTQQAHEESQSWGRWITDTAARRSRIFDDIVERARLLGVDQPDKLSPRELKSATARLVAENRDRAGTEPSPSKNPAERGVTVRVAAESDLAALTSAFGDEALFRDRLARRAAGHGVLLIAWRSAEPVGTGYLWLEPAEEQAILDHLPDVPLLMNVRVAEQYQGGGIGTEIIAGLEDRAARAGHSRVALAVRTDNHDAIRLYRRLGYRDWGHGTIECIAVESLPDGRIVAIPEPEICYVMEKALPDDRAAELRDQPPLSAAREAAEAEAFRIENLGNDIMDCFTLFEYAHADDRAVRAKAATAVAGKKLQHEVIEERGGGVGCWLLAWRSWRPKVSRPRCTSPGRRWVWIEYWTDSHPRFAKI